MRSVNRKQCEDYASTPGKPIEIGSTVGRLRNYAEKKVEGLGIRGYV